MHNSVEDYLLGKSEFLHPDIHKNYGQWMTGLRDDYAELLPEWKWGVTWEFKPCDYNAPDCMLHGFVDLLAVPTSPDVNLDLFEWKTGGIYDEHITQTHIYSVIAMCHFPDRPGVDATTTYFDKQDYKSFMYPKTMMFEYKPMLRKKIGTIADATMFPAMPSFKCKWCKFSRHNGGPCQF